MTISDELSAILQMRLQPEYQAAERIRQRIGAAAMASSPSTSEDYGAVRLMIGTWETIAIRVRGNEALKVPFYQLNPVGYMWGKLVPGIKIIRSKDFKPRSASFYAQQFKLLNQAYGRWLADQPPAYRTAALEGINAQFG